MSRNNQPESGNYIDEFEWIPDNCQSEENMDNPIVSDVRQNFLASLDMVNRIIKYCPTDLWDMKGPTESIAKRILHIIESVDYRLSMFEPYLFRSYADIGRPQIQDPLPKEFTRDVLRQYFLQVSKKALRIFDQLTDSSMTGRNKNDPSRSNLDVFFGQVRHIQVNVGICNEYLRAHGAKSEEWIGSCDLPKDYVLD